MNWERFLCLLRSMLVTVSTFLTDRNFTVYPDSTVSWDKTKTRNWSENGSKNGSIKLKISSSSGRGRSFHGRSLTPALVTSTGHQNVHASFSSHTKWNCLIPILSGLVKFSCFRDENVSHKSPMCISGKITTVPRLFSEHLTQNENKHQIMSVHTKWNCLIPILSRLVKY